MDGIVEALELAAAEGTRQQVGPCMLTSQTCCAVLEANQRHACRAGMSSV